MKSEILEMLTEQFGADFINSLTESELAEIIKENS